MRPGKTLLGALLAAAGVVVLAGPAAAASDPSLTPAAVGCRYEAKIPGVWSTGFVGTITVTNTGSVTIEDWRLEFNAAPFGAFVTQVWDGALISFHDPVRIDAPSWGKDLLVGKSHEVGFLGEFVANSGPVTISNVKLNGVACTS